MTDTWAKLGDVAPSAFSQTIQWLKYVPHDMVKDYVSKGWEIADTLADTKHGEHAILMRAHDNSWLPVVGWEGLYEVSLNGKVRSCDRLMTSETARQGYPRRLSGRILKSSALAHGYHQVSLHGPGGRYKRAHVAHLVAEAWHGERPNGKEVCHCDGDKDNNHANNLRYASHIENEADKNLHGTRANGERLPQSKLSEPVVREIRRRAVRETSKEIAASVGVSVNTIDFVIHRRVWGHLLPGPGEVGTPAADAERKRIKKERYAAHARSINPHAPHNMGHSK